MYAYLIYNILMKRTCIFLTEQQVEKLRVRANTLGISMAELLRRLLDEALQREEKKRG